MKIKNKDLLVKLYVIFLIFFSIIFNQYYGYIGILPIDSFLIFNSGYDLLNGYFPFKDYWTIKEPFIDLIQAIFFKLFGVSWFSYVFHASFFNCLIAVSTFYFLKKLKLNTNLSFFYSICVSILTYPTVGTPFSDHHTLIICLFSFYFFILAIENQNNLYWFLIPILLGFSFMSKQAPTLYVILFISFISLIFFVKTRSFANFFAALAGIFTILLLFFVLLFIAKINLNDFITQYYLYPTSLGGSRLEWVFPLEFKRVIWRFKLQYLSIAILIYLFVKFSFTKKIFIFKDYLIFLSIISLCLTTIFHQLMTINAIFIYCLIPIFCGLSHIYSIKYLNSEKYIGRFLITLTICSTFYYYFIN